MARDGYTDTDLEAGLENFQENQPVATFQVASSSSQDTIELPDAAFIRESEILRDGQDLVLEAPNGETVVIEGYFSADPAPVLMSGHIGLTPDMVDSFVRSPDAAFAQKGTLSDVSPVGEISEISGDAFVIRTNGVREPLVLGADIYEGDVLETSADGAVNIKFVDDSSFAVSENAKLVLMNMYLTRARRPANLTSRYCAVFLFM